jgi:hypothetical protein
MWFPSPHESHWLIVRRADRRRARGEQPAREFGNEGVAAVYLAVTQVAAQGTPSPWKRFGLQLEEWRCGSVR